MFTTKMLLEASRQRFTAGTTAESAIAAARRLPSGIVPIFNHLGEHLHDTSSVQRECEEYRRLMERFSKQTVRRETDTGVRSCRLSVKPTQLGLDLARRAENNFLGNIAALSVRAESLGDIGIEIDTETSYTIDPTLFFADLATSWPDRVAPLRVAIAARRPRSRTDILFLNSLEVPVRLIKGAYADSPEDTLCTQQELRERFRACAELLLAEGTDPAFATHDSALIQWILAEAKRYGRAKQDFEFQFLKGLRPRTQRTLLKRGYRVASYLPYGNAWQEYALRRWDFFKRLRRDPRTFFAYLFL